MHFITNGYKRFLWTNSSDPLTVSIHFAFIIVPWSLGQWHSFNLSQLPGEYTAPSCQGAPKAFLNTIATSVLAGTLSPSGEKQL